MEEKMMTDYAPMLVMAAIIGAVINGIIFLWLIPIAIMVFIIGFLMLIIKGLF